MAENEYLDSSKARRWLSVAEGIRGGIDMDELMLRVQDRFYKTLKTLRKDIPFAELMAAVDNPAQLAQLCGQIDGATDVKDLLLRAAFENVGSINIIERFLKDALQNCMYDIPYLAARLDRDVNISHARQKMNAILIRLAPDLHRLATKFAENPFWRPLRKRAPATTKLQVDTTMNMLGESLISGFRK